MKLIIEREPWKDNANIVMWCYLISARKKRRHPGPIFPWNPALDPSHSSRTPIKTNQLKKEARPIISAKFTLITVIDSKFESNQAASVYDPNVNNPDSHVLANVNSRAAFSLRNRLIP